MKTFIIGLMIFVSPVFSLAHNPLSARYDIKVRENVGILSINLSQDGVNQALLHNYGNAKLESLDRQAFEELIVSYIKNHFFLSFDKREIKLNKGGIRVGHHQTDLKFVLPQVPYRPKTVEIHIPAFSENNQHQTIFSYDFMGITDHVILSSKNDYRSSISMPVNMPGNRSLEIILAVMSGVVVTIITVSILILKKRHSNYNLAAKSIV